MEGQVRRDGRREQGRIEEERGKEGGRTRKGQEKKAKGVREGGSIVRKMQTSSFQSKQTCWY